MNNTQEMQNIVTSIVRGADEALYLELANEGMNQDKAFTTAINSAWNLPEDIEVQPESADAYLEAASR